MRLNPQEEFQKCACDSFSCEQTPHFSLISHLLPIAGSVRGHFLCPEEAQRQAGERADWTCLRSKKEAGRRCSGADEGVEADVVL